MTLSKSDYMQFLRHPALLWLKKYEKQRLPAYDDNTQAMFDAGHEFEIYAEKLYPEAVRVGFENYSEYKTLPYRTWQEIENGAQTILQGGFEAQGIACVVDVLEKVDDKTFDLIEIKSSTKAKPEHEYDLAFQIEVLNLCGYSVRNISVIHANNEYIRDGEIEVEKLIARTDVSKEVKELEDLTREQIDNDIRSERARNGLHTRYMSGLISGKCPIGYKYSNGLAVKDHETWDKVKRAWDIMASGKTSLSQIGKIMTNDGLRIKHGKKLHEIRMQTANRIFRSKFYAGILTSNTYKEEVKGQHVPMITLGQYYKVQAILDGRRVSNMILVRRSKENKKFPLRRIVKCGICGSNLTGGWSKGRNKKYAYYRCSGKCTKSINVDKIDEKLIDLLKIITPEKPTLNLFLFRLRKVYKQRHSRLKLLKDKADTEILNLQEMRRQLVEKNLNGIYSDEIFAEQNIIIEDKMTKAQIVKDDSLVEKYNINKIEGFIRKKLADLVETYKTSTLNQIKIFLGSIFPSGLSWDYKGTLNHKISPMYQYIEKLGNPSLPFGAGKGSRTPLISLES